MSIDFSVSKDAQGNTIVEDSASNIVYSSGSSSAALQEAIDRTVVGHGVQVRSGQYVLTKDIEMKRGVSLIGKGDDTIFTNGTINVRSSDTCVKALRMEGTCHIAIASNDSAISNVLVQDVSASTGVIEAVYSIVSNTHGVSDVRFINATTVDSEAYGFKLAGNGTISDILFDSCKAIRSGLTDRPDDWVVGFDLGGSSAEVNNIVMERCEASYNWESGFFLNDWRADPSVVLRDCLANNNGMKPTYQDGYGYVLADIVQWINSTGAGNKGGLTNLDPFPPTVAKETPQITLEVASSTVQTGNTVRIDGMLTRATTSGTVPISAATIDLILTLPNGDTVNPAQGSLVTTNAQGEFVVEYTPTTVGAYSCTASYAGDATYNGTASSVSFNAVDAPPQKAQSSMTLTLSGANVNTGTGIHASGLLKGATGIAGATIEVKIALPGGGFASPTQGATVTTDASGEFAVDYVPSAEGSYVITATYGGSTEFEASSVSASFTAVAPSEAPSHDYIVSGSEVKTSSGGTAYTGGSFTAALNWACTQANKVVYVPAGRYQLSNSINFASGVTLVGDGAERTVFTFTSGDYNQISFQPTNVDNVKLMQFGITGAGSIAFSVTSGTHGNNLVQDVKIWDTNNLQVNAFGSWVSSGATVSNFKFIRCVAYNVGANGFALMGNFPWNNNHGLQTNIYFEDCKAMYCGFTSNIWDWTVGYDLAEQCNINGLTLVRCEASYNWESGFHIEYSPTVDNCVFQDCVANYNGQSYSDPRGAVWGAGYLYFGKDDVTRTNSGGTGNSGGTQYSGDRFGYDDKGNGYTYRVSGSSVYSSSGGTAYSGSSFTDALQWACSKTNAVVKIPAGTYTVNGRITLASGVTLYGGLDVLEWFASPGDATVLNFGTGADQGFLVHNANNVRMSLLQINNGNVEIVADGGATVSNVQLRGITVNQATAEHPAAIYAYSAGGSTIDGLDIGACKANGAHTDGFRFAGAGSGSNALMKNLKLWFCEAIGSGQTSPRSGDNVGFRFGDGVNIQAATVQDCHAENSYCSGFFFSPSGSVTGVTLQDCVANNNGQKGDASNGMGYQLNGQAVQTVNCSGTGNAGTLIGS